ncbi:hypothetical protein C8R44DRAFT_730785 [Mycena epipterygia]|nr:hypothetical protein C8R44DRAFT_730785 [Mycena epipterygia]
MNSDAPRPCSPARAAVVGYNKDAAALIDEAEELRYQLSVAQGEKQEASERMLDKEHQIYEMRKLFWRIGTRLTARENHLGSGTTEDQLAEAKRFIASIGGQLEDGARGLIDRVRQRNRGDSG